MTSGSRLRSGLACRAPRPDGITAPLVYVRGGLAADYRRRRRCRRTYRPRRLSAERRTGSAIIGMEATAQGAAGMILTSTRRDTALFAGPCLARVVVGDVLDDRRRAVRLRLPPRRRSARRLAAGPVTATMRSDVAVTSVAHGGVAYNVVGELPGSAGADDLLVIGAHQDAFFRGAVDNASGVAGLLTMARAMRESGYRPERTIVFVSHTAEEFGLADSQYDWCVGSWRLLTAHADWPGRVAAELELDEIGFRRAPAVGAERPGARSRGCARRRAGAEHGCGRRTGSRPTATSGRTARAASPACTSATRPTIRRCRQPLRPRHGGPPRLRDTR